MDILLIKVYLYYAVTLIKKHIVLPFSLTCNIDQNKYMFINIFVNTLMYIKVDEIPSWKSSFVFLSLNGLIRDDEMLYLHV